MVVAANEQNIFFFRATKAPEPEFLSLNVGKDGMLPSFLGCRVTETMCNTEFCCKFTSCAVRTVTFVEGVLTKFLGDLCNY